MAAAEFISWMQYFLEIPLLYKLANEKFEEDIGYVVETCTHHHLKRKHKRLDVHANHANSGCPSAVAGRSWRHSLIKWTVYNAAKEADLIVTMEPKTRNILLGQFSTQMCQSLFPKKPNKETQKEISKIKNKLKH